MDIHVKVFVRTYIFISLGSMPRSTTVGYMVTVCLVFKKLPNCFRVAMSFYFPTSNVWVIQYLCILISTWCLSRFYCSHSDRCVVTSHYGAICISVMANDVKYLFMCIFAICISSKVKSVSSAHFLMRILVLCFKELFCN